MTIAIRGLAPLFQVFDMPTSIRFYRDVLGFEVVSSAPPGDDCDWALLRLDGADRRRLLAPARPRPPSERADRARLRHEAALCKGSRRVRALLPVARGLTDRGRIVELVARITQCREELGHQGAHRSALLGRLDPRLAVNLIVD